jgi:transcription termination factor NusB
MIAPARVAAFDVLRSVSAGRADLSSAVARARMALDDERDRALTSEIATGVQRMRAAIDHLIVVASKRRLERLDPEIVDILRLSLYQLLYLTRVPAAAVVNDAVKLAARAGKRSAAGFVNAVLRTLSRTRSTLPLPVRPTDPGNRAAAVEYLSVTLSHPRWLAERWYDRLGLDAAERWMEFNNRPAPLTLRANRLRITPADLRLRLAARDITVAPGRYAPDALVVESGHPLREDGDEGWFVAQDEASQLVALLVGAHPGPRVLDACASPGGKTTAIAATLGEGDRVVACDVRDRQRANRPGRSPDAAALPPRVRHRSGRRPMLGAGDASPRSGHPVAPHRVGAGLVRGRGAADAATRGDGGPTWGPPCLCHVLERTRRERGRCRGLPARSLDVRAHRRTPCTSGLARGCCRPAGPPSDEAGPSRPRGVLRSRV